MNDLLLLKILETKDKYDKWYKYINNIPKEIAVVLKDMGRWYQDSGREEVDWPAFQVWFKHTQHVAMQPDMIDVFDKLFTLLNDVEYEEEDVAPILRGFIDRSVGDNISVIAGKISGGDSTVSMEDVRAELEKRDREVGVDEEDGVAEWGKPIQHVRGTLRWRLNELNASVGPVGKGDFIVVGARPDAGKTTFLASEITHMASQLPSSETLLWLNNEERAEKIQSRILCAALNKTYEEVEADWAKAYEEYKAAINGDVGKIVLKDISGAYVSQINRLVKKLKPSVIVIDQLRKIHGFERETGNETGRQELVFNWARDLAKAYAPIITVHQADGTAENKEWIDMSQLHMSKCLAKGTEILMYDGTRKAVENVHVGEKVMGMDSTPRLVEDTASGREEMYRIAHTNGLSYTVNKSHILTLKKTTAGSWDGAEQGDVVDMPLSRLLSTPTLLKHFKGFTLPINHQLTSLPIDPYIFGLWITDGKAAGAEWATVDPEFREAICSYAEENGYEYKEWYDGSCYYPRLKYKQGVPHPFINVLKDMNVWKNKHIPDVYLQGSVEQRLQFLAGLIDGDGNINKRQHTYYTICSGDERMAKSMQLLALSCGFNSTVRSKGSSFVIHISGDVSSIPVRIVRKKTEYRSERDVTTSTLYIEALGEGEYYGITVDGDSRYVLGNYIPTHNTGIQGEADAIITIGRTMDKPASRFIYVPKNKMKGDDPSLRNGMFEVTLDGERARFIGVV